MKRHMMIKTTWLMLLAAFGLWACDDGDKKKTDPQPPAAPTALTATAVDGTHVDLAWTDNADDETGFVLERSLDGVTFAEIAAPTADATGFADSGLLPGTTYHYRVAAENAAGLSAWSNVAEVTTPAAVVPAAPTDLTAEAVSANTIELAWTDNADDETGFEVEMSTDGESFAWVETLPADTVAWANGDLAPETRYWFRVRAIGAEGDSAWSNVADATTLSDTLVPAAPTDLEATVDGTTAIRLTWTDNADDETGYVVERSEDGTTFTQMATAAADATTWTDTGARTLTTYFYRVAAVNADGQSDFSNVATARIEFAAFTNFQAAFRVLGQADFVSRASNRGQADPSADTLDGPYGNPRVIDGVLYVPDYSNERVLGFWSVPTTDGAAADFVLGQADFVSDVRSADATGMEGPQTIHEYYGRFFVLDYGNSRILSWNTPPVTTQVPADLVIGQPAFGLNEGACAADRLQYPESFIISDGRLIVGDTNNHRVLIWNTLPTALGTPADVVLGQAAFDTCAGNDDDQDNASDSAPSARTFYYPNDVWSDGTRLILSDSGNNRILIWNTFPSTDFQPADLVLGQSEFTHYANNDDDQDGVEDATPSARTMSYPYMLACNGTQLVVADGNNNRVLIWNAIPTTDYAPADVVLGQSDFTHYAYNDDDQDGTQDATPSARTFAFVSGLYLFESHLYVMDNGNNRVLVFEAQ
jgi:hypothetical protein